MDWRSRVTDYLAARLPSAASVEISRVMGMPAGASNETVGLDILVRCDDREYIVPLVLRPQRRDGILAPYDVSRQFRVMRALVPTDVPVPATLWFEPGLETLGVPFFFMSRIPGETPPLFWYGGTTARLHAIAAALASIHAVDWRARDLNFLIEGNGAASPAEHELRPWQGRYQRSGLASHPIAVQLLSFLLRNEPADARLALLHGDPNPGNYLLQGDSVAAVLDWELAAIGDPRSDLGFYAALLTIFAGMSSRSGHTVLSDAYAAVTGLQLTSLDYYEALGLYRMAVVMAGWMGPGGAGHSLGAIARRLEELFGPRWAA